MTAGCLEFELFAAGDGTVVGRTGLLPERVSFDLGLHGGAVDVQVEQALGDGQGDIVAALDGGNRGLDEAGVEAVEGISVPWWIRFAGSCESTLAGSWWV